MASFQCKSRNYTLICTSTRELERACWSTVRQSSLGLFLKLNLVKEPSKAILIGSTAKYFVRYVRTFLARYWWRPGIGYSVRKIAIGSASIPLWGCHVVIATLRFAGGDGGGRSTWKRDEKLNKCSKVIIRRWQNIASDLYKERVHGFTVAPR